MSSCPELDRRVMAIFADFSTDMTRLLGRIEKLQHLAEEVQGMEPDDQIAVLTAYAEGRLIDCPKEQN